MKAIPLRAVFISIFIWASHASAQTVGDLPFSVGAIGMGGVSASVPSDNAMALSSNPAQAGLFSLNEIASLSAYIRPSSAEYAGISSMHSSAAEVGFKLTRYLSTPFKTSVGVGYSIEEMGIKGAQPDGRVFAYAPYYRLNSLTLGLGLEDIVKVGIGFTYGWGSSGDGFYTSNDNADTHAYGLMAQVPIVQLIEGQGEESTEPQSRLQPLLNCNLAFAMGDFLEAVINDSEVLLRETVFGVNLEAGIETRNRGLPFRLISVLLAREADEPLLRGNFIEAFGFMYGNTVNTSRPTYFKSYENLILGTSDGKVGIRSGLQIEAAEFLYLRYGSMKGLDAYPSPWYNSSSTFGWGVRLDGLLRLLSMVKVGTYTQISRIDVPPVLSCIVRHVNLEFDYSKVEYDENVSQFLYQLSLVIS